MGAVGNSFWRLRSSHGAKPKFSDPDKLWDACTQYFDDVEENPLKGSKLVSFQGESVIEEIPFMRAMTINGLCNYIDICQKTWQNYREKDDLLPVITRVESIIYDQKFTGAAADLLNANIIARDLGLKDQKELTGKDGQALEVNSRTEFIFIPVGASEASTD